MAAPFDVPDLEDDEAEAPRGRAGARTGDVPGLDDEATPRPSGGFDVPDLDEAAPAAPQREAGTGEDWIDFLLGGYDGALLGNTRNLGKLVDRAPEFADAVSPVLGGAARVAHAFEPDWADELGDLVDSAQETPAGKAGRLVGTGASAIGLGAAAGPGIAAQAALGAGLSGAEALGDTDGDWLAALEAMPVGAGFGAAGGALASRVGARPTLQQYGQSALWGAGLGAVTSPSDPIRGAARGAGSSVAGRALLGHMPQSFGTSIRAAGQLGAAGAGTAAGALAQEPEVAYGTAPTMAWAAQSVLASGDSGLPPEDEQRLTEAMLDGDEDKVISANFALQMKHPGYGARLQRELESLQQEE